MYFFIKYCYLPFLLLSSLFISSCSSDYTSTLLNQLPEERQQVLLVTSKSWNSPKGTLQRYERRQNRWSAIGKHIPVTLGRNGTAWGRGLHSIQDLTHFKQEGDGRAPAGIFSLGSSFGYSNKPVERQHYPYRQADERDYYIDDIESADYNQWVRIPRNEVNTPKNHWKSFERMHRDDARYEWGIEVEHNKHPVISKAGSAIFMHVWENSDTPTAGCTAMEKSSMIEILKWLNVDKKPVLIQAPISELKKLQYFAKPPV